MYGEILYESMINHDLAFEDVTLNLELLESSSGCSRFKNIVDFTNILTYYQV